MSVPSESAWRLWADCHAKEGSNIQDTCVVHGDGRHDTIIEEDGHIGHGAVIQVVWAVIRS